MANNCLLDYLANSPTGLIRRDQPSLKTFYFGKIPRARLNALLSCYPPTNKQQVENGNDFRLETRTGKHVISAADAATIMKEAAQPDQPASSQTIYFPSLQPLFTSKPRPVVGRRPLEISDFSHFPDVCYTDQMFFHDHVTSERVWQQPISHWFAHMPHFYSREALSAVESALASEYAIARQNRFRNPFSDISTHLQYEAKLQHDVSHGGARVVDVNVARWFWRKDTDVKPSDHVAQRPVPGTRLPFKAMYQAFVFQDCKPLDIPLYWARVVCKMQLHEPQFLAVDDDLPDDADQFCLQRHAGYFLRFMQHFFPQEAPWELSQRVLQIASELIQSDPNHPDPTVDITRDPELLAVLRSGKLSCSCEIDLYHEHKRREEWLC